LKYKVTYEETVVAEPEKDLTTLLEDVKTIKAILQNEDAPFPQVWKGLYTVATALAVVGLVQYLVPFFRDLDFDGKVLWLWLPGVLIMAPVVLAILHRELNRAGRGVLSQARVRHVLFARFVIPPGALVLMWVGSRNPVFGLEGVSLVLVAIWQTALEQILPEEFHFVPLLFLGGGIVELLVGWRGPEVILANVAFVVAALVYAATLLRNARTKVHGTP